LKNRDWRDIKDLAYYSSIGLQVALSILIGYFFGSYLDGKFHTEPWLTVIFFLLGVAAAVRNIGLVIKKLRKF
jgi:ATP synthase protein I